jgi:hypothetical protein
MAGDKVLTASSPRRDFLLMARFAMFCSMKRFVAPIIMLLLPAVLWFSSARGFNSAQADRLTVVELYTSQGCSSCPPADAYLRDLTKQAGVLPLSFYVDYWDYLGWSDTLASPANTKRQRGYARTFGQRQIYTPQMVIDGRFQAVGSDRRGVRLAIEKAAKVADPRLNVSISEKGKDLIISIAGKASTGHHSGATIWLVTYDSAQEVKIRRGENTGKKISYHNVVREFHSLGLWRGKDMEIAVMRAELTGKGRDACAVIIQAGMHGPILGAAKMALR